MIYLTSDIHFLHEAPFVYKERGYSSMEEHDKGIIKNWNETINDDDIVIVLGDIYMSGNHSDAVKLINKLNGNIILIRGNHCTDKKVENIIENCPKVEVMGWSMPFRYKGYRFFLSHYPALPANYDEDAPLKFRTINLCGHKHTTDKFEDFSLDLIYHVELDAHNNTPVLLDTIISDILENI